MSILFTALFSGIEIIWDRQFGFLKETLVAPVSRLEIMVGRTLGGATVATLQGFQLIMNFLVMPIFFLSGALFPLNGLPKALGMIVKVNPLAYGVDGLRGTLAHLAQFGLFTDFLVLTVITLALLSLGAYLFSKIQV
ncbi:MAG: antibiotic transport system permease protein [Parcubacteria group bacterium Licking1014_17]|nr:MAG: antibiotic transport system permease protein [Parcubacteria group bacterium Licking1014_17]